MGPGNDHRGRQDGARLDLTTFRMGRTATTERALILRTAPSGESFRKIDILAETTGYVLCLQRISKKASSPTGPDIFDSADILLEQSRNGNAYFLKECQIVEHRRTIGQSYQTLKYASEFCTLILLNARHMADPGLLYRITERTLNAFAERKPPEIVSLKALYLLLKDEGYPVRESWWPQLPKHLREPARQLINEPLPETTFQGQLTQCSEIQKNLRDWLRRETDFVLR